MRVQTDADKSILMSASGSFSVAAYPCIFSSFSSDYPLTFQRYSCHFITSHLFIQQSPANFNDQSGFVSTLYGFNLLLHLFFGFNLLLHLFLIE